jgi:hypothetical protein
MRYDGSEARPFAVRRDLIKQGTAPSEVREYMEARQRASCSHNSSSILTLDSAIDWIKREREKYWNTAAVSAGNDSSASNVTATKGDGGGSDDGTARTSCPFPYFDPKCLIGNRCSKVAVAFDQRTDVSE